MASGRWRGGYDLHTEGGPIVVVGEQVYIPEVGIVRLKQDTGQLPPVEYVDQRCFPETGHCMGGPLRAYWEQHGGPPVFSFPLGPARHELNRDLNGAAGAPGAEMRHQAEGDRQAGTRHEGRYESSCRSSCPLPSTLSPRLVCDEDRSMV